MAHTVSLLKKDKAYNLQRKQKSTSKERISLRYALAAIG